MISARTPFELSHGPGHAMPGNEWVFVAGLPLPTGPSSQQEKPFSHRGRAVTKGERTMEKEREPRAPLSWLSQPASFEHF